MTRILNTAALAAAALVFSVLAARESGAVPITLNFVQADSHATLGGSFGGIPFSPQDSDPPGPGGAIPPGVVDFDPTSPSNRTTFQGTITIDVDSVNSPSSIQILSSNANADLSGEWIPEVQPFLDRDLDNSFGEFGDDSCPAGGAQPPDCTPGDATPAPPMPADWGFRNIHPGFGVDVAYGSVRDLEFSITSPAEPVVAGQFSSLSENFEFAAGWLDYWVAPAAGNLRGRAELAGGDNDNQSAVLSSYTVTPLPGNKREIKLTIPLSILDEGDDATFSYTGQFVATLVVPEPSTIAMLFCGLLACVAARRKRG
jgi:hypothetical protein